MRDKERRVFAPNEQNSGSSDAANQPTITEPNASRENPLLMNQMVDSPSLMQEIKDQNKDATGTQTLLEQDREDRINDRVLKTHFANYIFWFLACQTLIIDVLIYFNGFKLTFLSPTIIEILVSSTIVQVFGSVYLIVKHLFPTK